MNSLLIVLAVVYVAGFFYDIALNIWITRKLGERIKWWRAQIIVGLSLIWPVMKVYTLVKAIRLFSQLMKDFKK